MTSDIEMRDSNDPANTDSDSSELTVESDQASEYELEEILSERFKHGQREYLVKWANYDLIRSTWEPRTSFDQAETLNEWNAKKREIKAGRIPVFDVVKLRKDKRAVKIATRKARLELRRARQREQAHRFLTLDSSDSASDPEPADNDKVNTSSAVATQE
ncbi:uncharacterized protein N7459_004495 [Penicillium hispanicum]|uniref:uncharacterized protein n=1 Tax=Penicillium hispanicum TaxID=1080232 RepID=UPI002540C0A7|nr:uncharacterized protein N7459_004495 [Penicillium hispanicum]KAJ5584695.1 hypothetical protein N7459_004495 [Penicillium hispanicum]